ncbi:MAG: hypothetical protein WEE64_08370 [Dehalococcoidia bacterium]
MVTKPKRELPGWATEYLESRRPPTKRELQARKRAFEGALKLRERLDIRPLRMADIIRELRDEDE